ncbi:MAG TPA: methyltransferase domain-containing protein [Burkholderiales bacterium]|nr:methyltransferase domain-containing protein [Burkholderiales bacterium]
MRFFSRRIHKAVSAFDTVEISEHKGIRYLHLSNNTVQSAMRLSDPYRLELTYTQAMAGCLLFNETPRNALLIGLGGGSLAKFLYRHFSEMHIAAVEINPKVIDAAYEFFFLPRDEPRLQIICADGRQYPLGNNKWDCIFLDGFDANFQVAGLASADFYQRCAAALSPAGILTVNLWGSDPDFELYRQRLGAAFEGRIACLPAEKRGNVIVFAFGDPHGFQDWKTLRLRAAQLQQKFNLPFTDFVARLRQNNQTAEN